MLTKYTEPYPGYQRFSLGGGGGANFRCWPKAEATKPETALDKALAPRVTEPEDQDEIKV